MRLNENELDRLEGQVEGLGFATEILKQLKDNSKKLWIAIIILIIALVGTNMAWLYCWMQYDYSSYEQTTDSGGINNYIGKDGDINNGNAENQNQDQKE